MAIEATLAKTWHQHNMYSLTTVRIKAWSSLVIKEQCAASLAGALLQRPEA